MLKARELADPNSCLNRARDDEMVFTLLARDVAAPYAIRAWIEERIRLGKNRRGDPQIVNAEHTIEEMLKEQQYGKQRMFGAAGK